MPKGFRTEDGPRPDWAKKYGLTENNAHDYSIRTWENVKTSHVTFWFGLEGAGYKCTRDAAKYYNLPFKVNPTADEFRDICAKYDIVNIAGNRISKNPAIRHQVAFTFEGLPRYEAK